MTEALDVDVILQRVASGELSPEAAHALLTASGGQGTPADTPAWGAPGAGRATTTEPGGGRPTTEPGSAHPTTEPGGGRPTTEPGAGGSGTTVKVNASYRTVEVIADASVRELAVEGRHTVHREDGVLVVEATDLPLTFGEGREGAPTGPRFSFDDLPRSLAWARSWKAQNLVVRVNPALAVEVEAVGAAVRLRGLTGGLKLRLVASGATVDGLRGRLDLDAFTSSVKGNAVLVGTGRLQCESSSVKLTVGGASDVTITSHNRLGKVVLPDAVSTAGLADSETTTSRLGAGSGRLEIDALMSSVVLTKESAA